MRLFLQIQNRFLPASMRWQGLHCTYAAAVLLLFLCTVAWSAAAAPRRALPTVPIPFDDIYTFNYAPGSRVTELLEVLRNDFSPDNSTALTIVGVTAIAPPLLGQLSIAQGAITYSVGAYDGYGNTDFFEYSVRDSGGRLGTGTVAVNLVATAAPFSAVADNFNFQYPAGSNTPREVLNVLANDIGSGLRIQRATPVGKFAGTLQVRTNRRSVLYSIASYSGETLRDQFTYDVTDSAGRITKSALVTIDVSPSQAAAIVANADTYTFTAVTGQIVNQALQVLSNDQGNALRLVPAASGAAVTPFPPRSALQGTVALSGNALGYRVVFTGVAFTDQFRYRVEDANGQTASAVVTVNVATAPPTPIPPLARDDSFAFAATSGRPFSAQLSTVLSNDNGDGIFISFVAAAGSTHGVPSIGGNGQFLVYTLQQYSGATFTDRFTYRITDRNGLTSTASVAVTMSPNDTVSRPVVARDDFFAFTAASGRTFSASLTTVLSNDDGDSIYISFVASAGFTSGVPLITGNGQVLTYTLQQYNGAMFTDRFTYRITDQNGMNSTATVSITMSPTSIPSPPLPRPVQARDDAFNFTASPGSTFNANLSSVLNNDDGDQMYISFVASAGPTFGIVRIAGNGQGLAYSVQQYTGATFTDRFTYRITDGSGATSTATVSVSMSPIGGPSPPVLAVPDEYRFQLDDSGTLARQTLNVKANDSGIGIRLTSYITSNFFGRVEWDKTNDVFYYTVADSYVGNAFVWYLNYTISDVTFQTSSSQATIRVDPGASFKANDDTFNITVAPNSILTRFLYVLNNDLGSSIELAGYDDSLQANVGSLEVSADKQYMVYKLTTGGTVGLTFTDKFKYQIVRSTDTSVPKKQKTALLTVNIRVA